MEVGDNGVEGLVAGEGKQILSQLISMGVALGDGLSTVLAAQDYYGCQGHCS